jgi:hypothetical protein
MKFVEHAPTFLTAAMGSATTAATEILPDGFFQAISQLLIAAVTVWKLLHDSKKGNAEKPKDNK